MRSIGTILFIGGLGSIVLHFLNMNFALLMWIDNWGETTGWIIRIALVLVGAALWFFGSGDEDEAVAE